jgi:hypothetical protein
MKKCFSCLGLPKVREWVSDHLNDSGMLLLGGGCESNQELPGACTAPICFFVKMDGMNVSNLQYRIAE